MEKKNVLRKIVLITTGQPSVNPRIVKEADVLQNAGFDVTVLYCFFINWASEKDEALLSKACWKYKLIGGSPTINKYNFLLSKISNYIFRILNRRIGNHFLIAERSQARGYDELLRAAKKIKADWYIGHNLGALPVVVKAAAFHKAKAGFDFEDYHRGEGHEKITLQRMIFLEKKYIHSLHYISTASTLISDVTKKNHPYFNGPVITLFNCFPLSQQPNYINKNENDTTLNLFWFSQTIGIKRGLEELVKALNYLNDSSIHVTFAGRCNEDMYEYFKEHGRNLLNNIHFAGIIQPEELPDFAAQFDIGLALETGFSENNDIALSNKILTYLLAGNAMILSETTMQHQFNIVYKVGKSFEINNLKQFADQILLYKNHDNLNAQKSYNYQLATTTLNWDNESKKLLAILQ